MIQRAFIQEQGNGRLIEEMALLRGELERRGIPVALFTEKKMLRGQVPVAPDALIAGQMPAMLAAMRQLGIPEPAPNDFPEALRPMLHRRVWKSTLAQVEAELLGGGEPRFVKPATRRKRFTGFVAAHIEDLRQCEGASRRDPLWCSQVVTWLSEYRVYVAHAKVLDINLYAGSPAHPLDRAVVDNAIQRLHGTGEALAAFALDLGVLSTGETALIELNDGFSIGAYGIAAAPYTDFTLARWEELVATSRR
jgi:hypothetical protein